MLHNLLYLDNAPNKYHDNKFNYRCNEWSMYFEFIYLSMFI